MVELWSSVEIEICTKCNRRCSFCPVSKIDRGEHYMSERLFKKIINYLSMIKFETSWHLSFNGRIGFHLFGEPTLHPKLIQFINYTRERNPLASLELTTNGKLLTVPLMKALSDVGVNLFEISEYTDKLNKNVIEFIKKYPRLSHKVQYRFVPNEGMQFVNRGGLIKKEDLPKGYDFFHTDRCQIPKKCLRINCKGDVVLCCNEYEGKYTFGNINTEDPLSIWSKPEYVKIRDEIEHGVFKLDICKKCAGIE